MGFFGLDDTPPPKSKQQAQTRGVNVAAVREAGCALCPLNDAKCKSPKMKPNGIKDPLVYILGDAPSRAADAKGTPFAGDAAAFIRRHIPGKYRDAVRWNNVIRTHPGEGEIVEGQNKDDKRDFIYTKDPPALAIEACRNSILEDIIRTKPEIVITVGAVPLRWIANETHAYLWQGRRFPAEITHDDGETIRSHRFWVYPFTHPYDAMKDRRWSEHVPDNEDTWRRHFKRPWLDLEKDEITAPVIHTRKDAEKNVNWVMGEGSEDLRRIEKHLDTCAGLTHNGMDYETSVLRPYQEDSAILTLSLTHKRETLAFPVDHKEALWTPKQKRLLKGMIKEYLMDPRPIKIAHQLAFEMEWSAYEFGRDVCRAGQWADTISQAYVINPRQGMLALEALTQLYWGINIKELSTVNRKKMADEPLAKILPYNGIDSRYHWKLHLKQMPIIKELDLEDVYAHQLARIPTLVLTQLQGVPINQKVLKDFRKKYERDRADALAALKELPCWDKFTKEHGVEFRPSATQDVQKMLRIIGSKHKKTDEKTLRTVDHDFPDALLKWRKPDRILGTYCDPVTVGSESSHVMPDEMIHPIISTYKVTTWRTSSEEPNAQNWPKRGPNVIIRRVVQKPGKKVVTFDYAGIQARNICMESKDRNLQEAFINGYDIHTEWVKSFGEAHPKFAPRGWDHDKNQFKIFRDTIKNGFVFPTFFGAKAKSITVSMNAIAYKKELRQEDVQEIQDELFGKFPRVHKWQNGLKQFYDKHGYVTGLSRFRRYAPVSHNELINSPIQSDESIIVLSAMNALSELDYKRYQAMMEIHDDLTFLWPEDEVEKRSEVVLREMTKVRYDWINVPLVVERSIGDNWCDLEKAGNFESVGTDGEFREMAA